MKKLILILSLGLTACAQEVAFTSMQPVLQKCTVSSDGQNNEVLTCPDGTTLILPPNTVIETVEVPVIVEVPANCRNDEGNEDHDDNDNEHEHHEHGKK